MFVTLFSNLFSRITGGVRQDKEVLAELDDTRAMLIREALSVYRSDNFPQGILPLAEQMTFGESDDEIVVELSLPFPCSDELQALADSLSESLNKNVSFRLHLSIKPVRHHNINNIANVIAIASGKGGVGKSTTTVNLAHALTALGAKVGILDADIYGPSLPAMLGMKNEKPVSVDGKMMEPIEHDGIAAMSIGFLIDDEQAMVWRGPMASSAFKQLLNETHWPQLDYLLIDMPPGTGDIQLTLAQSVPVGAAVIVTTPQDIALIDAQKGITMFDKVKVPVLGVVENMSYHFCENCGHESHLFGVGGGEEISQANDVALLGQLPLNRAIREAADDGENPITSAISSDIAEQYRKIAAKMTSTLYHQLDMRSTTTPKVTMK